MLTAGTQDGARWIKCSSSPVRVRARLLHAALHHNSLRTHAGATQNENSIMPASHFSRVKA